MQSQSRRFPFFGKQKPPADVTQTTPQGPPPLSSDVAASQPFGAFRQAFSFGSSPEKGREVSLSESRITALSSRARRKRDAHSRKSDEELSSSRAAPSPKKRVTDNSVCLRGTSSVQGANPLQTSPCTIVPPAEEFRIPFRDADSRHSPRFESPFLPHGSRVQVNYCHPDDLLQDYSVCFVFAHDATAPGIRRACKDNIRDNRIKEHLFRTHLKTIKCKYCSYTFGYNSQINNHKCYDENREKRKLTENDCHIFDVGLHGLAERISAITIKTHEDWVRIYKMLYPNSRTIPPACKHRESGVAKQMFSLPRASPKLSKRNSGVTDRLIYEANMKRFFEENLPELFPPFQLTEDGVDELVRRLSSFNNQQLGLNEFNINNYTGSYKGPEIRGGAIQPLFAPNPASCEDNSALHGSAFTAMREYPYPPSTSELSSGDVFSQTSESQSLYSYGSSDCIQEVEDRMDQSALTIKPPHGQYKETERGMSELSLSATRSPLSENEKQHHLNRYNEGPLNIAEATAGMSPMDADQYSAGNDIDASSMWDIDKALRDFVHIDHQ